MPKYRTKHLVIFAFRTSIPMIMDTRCGKMKARFGDWIVTDVTGEKFPCKDNIFRKKYEPIDDVAKEYMDPVHWRDKYE